MGWVIVYIQIQLFLLRKWEASEGREYNRVEAFGTFHYMSELSELKVPLSLFLITQWKSLISFVAPPLVSFVI